MPQPLSNPRGASEASQRYRLVALQPPSGTAGVDLALSGERIAIGSTLDNDLRIPDTSVSRQHALFEWTANGYRLSDRGSTNGTYVNGRRITTAVALRNGDEVRFGGRGYRLVRFAHQPVASPGRRRGVKAAVAIVAFAAIATAAFVGMRQYLPRERENHAGAPKPMEITREPMPPSPRTASPV